MAAPQIPNLLNSLRNSRTSRGRGGRVLHGPGSSADVVIQQTDDDAAGSRMSAVEVGYLDDPYARFMTKPGQNTRRMPIINRGTYVRTVAIDSLIKKFLAAHSNQPVQIVSLGAGTDTRPFRLLRNDENLPQQLVYHELDFSACTSRKVSNLTESKLLEDLDIKVSQDGLQMTSNAYNMHPVDLRKLGAVVKPNEETSRGSPDEEVSLTNFKHSTPTLILSECCLTYLNSSTSISILQYFLETLIPSPTPISVILYEPLHPNDAFGRTMTSNLSARGISLPGVNACPTLDAHEARLRECGFEKTGGKLVKDWWRADVSEDEKERLRNLEGLDEEEEWELLAGHYGFIWGSRGDQDWS